MVCGMVHINKGLLSPSLWLLHVADPIDRCCPSNEMYHHCQKLLIGSPFLQKCGPLIFCNKMMNFLTNLWNFSTKIIDILTNLWFF